MCGIAGYFGQVGSSELFAKSMIEAIRHRGPDLRSTWADNANGLCLAHARLSIIDLEATGNQPMHSASGRYTLAYNGEIYNYKKLRAKLESEKSHTWVGSSDTEVLLASFELFGLETTLNFIEGMFAIALWDASTQKLFLIRDRFGEKPLYVQHTSEGILFGSEIAAISAHPSASRELEPKAIDSLLRYGYVQAPYAILKNVYKVLPGSYWECSANAEVKSVTYWHPANVAKQSMQNPLKASDTEALDELDTMMGDVVADQMISDVPLGSFLSGGIDSSLVTAQMQRNSNVPVNTFSIGFESTEFDEAPFAKEVAEHLGTNHTEFYVGQQDVVDLVPQLSSIYSEPFADSSQIPTYLVSRLAKSKITVALSGDAGDEIFCGYNRHQFAKQYWKKIEKMPVGLRRFGANVVNRVPASLLNPIASKAPVTKQWSRPGEKLHRSASLLAVSSLENLYKGLCQILRNPELVTTDRFQQMLGNTRLPDFLDGEDIAMPAGLTDEQWMMLQDQITYLPGDILAKVDRAAMAVSLETRAPFLNHRLAEFAWSLPPEMLIRDGSAKWLPKALLRRYLPDSMVDRPKMGFSVPLHDLLRGPLREWVSDCLSNQSIEKGGVFDYVAVQKLWDGHLSEKENNTEKLWTIIIFQSWLSDAIANGILSDSKLA